MSPAIETATPLSTSSIDLSPAGLATGSLEVAGGTPGVDGIPRDANGIPLFTPATVTVRANRSQSPLCFRCIGGQPGRLHLS